MKYSDIGHEEFWNVRVYDGGGDTGYIWEATRAFCIENQSETAYWTCFKEDMSQEIMDQLFQRPHWSDPIYQPS